MIKVLMVCLGNICRSPLAEGILKDKIQKLNMAASVDSAGTGNYHAGEGADPRSVEVARKNNIDLNSHTARQFRTSDFDEYDLIYAMDKNNYRNILRLARNDTDKNKVRMIMNETAPGEDIDVPDPYFGGSHGFERVYDMLSKASDKIIDRIEKMQK
jgi:protein-tyrosine phosphatase